MSKCPRLADWDCLVMLRNVVTTAEIKVSPVGSVRAFLCENGAEGEGGGEQQMQINSCLCTFFHAVDASLPPLSLSKRGHSSRPSGFCAAMKGNSLDVSPPRG